MAERKILPINVLSTNKCSICFKYLSIGPIIIGANNEIICGRCMDANNSNLFIPSLYNVLATQFLYKCVNHFEGCNIPLEFNEAAEHEKVCKSEIYSCPFCPCKGICCQLMEHFKRFHSVSVIMKNKFKILLTEDDERYYVFITNKHIYVIKLVTDITNGEIWFSLHYLKAVSLAPPKLYFYVISSEIPALEYNMEEFKYLNPTDSTEYICSYKVGIQSIVNIFGAVNYAFCKISMEHATDDVVESFVMMEYERLRQHLEIKENEFKCVTQKLLEDIEKMKTVSAEMERKASSERQTLSKTCKQLTKLLLLDSISLPITCNVCACTLISNEMFHCTKNHFCCKSCKKSKCASCRNEEITTWSLFDLSKIINVPCSWENCNHVNTDFSAYLIHHRDCLFRIINCPLPHCKWSGNFRELTAHWHCVQPELFCDNELVFKCDQSNDYKCGIFWIIPDLQELFYVIFSRSCITLVEDNLILKKHYKYSLHGTIDNTLKTIDLGRKLLTRNCDRYYFNGKFILKRP